MLRQSAGTGKDRKKPDIEQEFGQRAEEIRQWIVREKGLEDEDLEVWCQGLTASFSYGGETLVLTGYPVGDGIKETGHLQEGGEKLPEKSGESAVNPLSGANGLWNYGRLWDYCKDILGESDDGAWHHDTYPLLANPGEQAVVLLYRTSGGEDGCLYLTDTMALRLSMGKEEREAGRLEEAKMYLEAIANSQKFVAGIKTPEKVAMEWDSLWTEAFQELCEGKVPYEDIRWADGKMREEAAWELKGLRGYALVSREEVMGLEALHISGAEEIGTFQDFRYMQNLHTLSVLYWEPEDVSELLGQLPVLSALTSLEIRNTGLSDLSFAEQFTGLEELVLDGKGIHDVSPLGACTELRELQLMGGEICDITPLSSLKELEYLVLNDNEVRCLDGLETLENLTFLDISHNQVEDLSPLAGMGQLEKLYAGDNGIVDITPLKGLAKLRWLSLEGNRIEDISVLAEIKGMVHLWAENNRIEDYKPLEGLDRLYFLSMDHDAGQDVGNLVKVPYLVLVPGMIQEDTQGEQMWTDLGEEPQAETEEEAQGETVCADTEEGAQGETVCADTEEEAWDETVCANTEEEAWDETVCANTEEEAWDETVCADTEEEAWDKTVCADTEEEAWDETVRADMEESQGETVGIDLEGEPEEEAAAKAAAEGATETRAGTEAEPELRLAQGWLDMLYPGWELEAKDMVKGDMNGDGINDMVIIGVLPKEKWEDGYVASGTWYLYPIMSDGDIRNGLSLTEPMLINGTPGNNVDIGYCGAALSNGQLMVQYAEYGCQDSVRKTDIYGYDGKQLVKKERQTLQYSRFPEDSVWRWEDLETGITQMYSIAVWEDGKRRPLLKGEIE